MSGVTGEGLSVGSKTNGNEADVVQRALETSRRVCPLQRASLHAPPRFCRWRGAARSSCHLTRFAVQQLPCASADTYQSPVCWSQCTTRLGTHRDTSGDGPDEAILPNIMQAH